MAKTSMGFLNAKERNKTASSSLALRCTVGLDQPDKNA